MYKLKFIEYIFIIFLFIIIILSIEGQQYEGEPCIMSINRQRGICTASRNCLPVLNDLKKGIIPQTCSYTATDVIICCPEIESVSTPDVEFNNNNRPNWSTQDKPNWLTQDRPFQQTISPSRQRISVQKCEEYGELVTHKTSFISLDINPDVNIVKFQECEFVQSTGLIVGGEVTKAGEFPHMAGIGWTEDGTVSFKCGGSLISDEYILTAGHCSTAARIPPDTIRLGDQNLINDNDDAKPENFQIAEIIKHPEFRPPNKYNDIALIRLDRRVNFSKYIRPACLWQHFNVNHTSVVATGWGAIFYTGPNSDDLQKVSLDLISNPECDNLYERSQRTIPNGIVDSQICAGDAREARDTCQGDSGGPIQIQTGSNKCMFHIIGITSFAKSCGMQDFGVYTRVSSYIDWIESIVWH